MKNQPGIHAPNQDQNGVLITNCPSPWLKPFTVDTSIANPPSVQAKLKCSPMSDGSDQPMSVSSSEQQSSSEEDEESEAETYPLLNNKQLDLIANVDIHTKEHSLTMNGMDDSAYQYQNYDPQSPIMEPARWDKWNGDWCPRNNWFPKVNPQNVKSNGHKFSPNPVLETTEVSNNNRNGIKFDGGIWHDSAWSRPKRTSAKSPTATSRSFEDMIVDVQAVNTLYHEFPLDATKSQTKEHNNMNSNSILLPESNYVDNNVPIANPFERFFSNIAPANSNTPLQKHKLVASKDIHYQSSKVANNIKERHETHVQPFMNENPQSNLSPNLSSPKNVNLKMLHDAPLKEIKSMDSTIPYNVSEDEKTFGNVFKHQTSVLKESSKDSEITKKRISTEDVNFVTRTFNNFSLSSSKRKEILRLLQERRKSRETNITETKGFPEETKILNIQNNLLRGHNTRRRYRKIDRQQIADGLVLEKVRYDPNWKRRNRILCTSDEVLKHFGDAPRRDANVPASVPTQTCGPMVDKSYKITNPVKSVNSSNGVPIPQTIESPTDNVSQIDNGELLISSDMNSNEDVPNKSSLQCKKQSHLSQDLMGSKSAKLPKQASELFGDFDVYNIETTMPTIDWVAMEAHLARAAEEDDWLTRRRNDREEIRKRLALGTEEEEEDEHDYYCGERMSRKPSLSTRLQSGMNLQICFMNETASDHESPVEDCERDHRSSETSISLASSSCSSRESSFGSTQDSLFLGSITSEKNSTTSDEKSQSNTEKSSEKCETKHQRPSFFFAKQRSWRLRPRHKHEQPNIPSDVAKDCQPVATEDFYTKQARLQAEARLALAQAKEMAKMQMEVEKQKKNKKSPIADIVGLSFPDNRHHFNRQLLQDMNVAQLQVIVNDLHSQIESHNEDLVHFLLKRDDLHMEQDSMLVDIEDLTRYLGAKEETQPTQQPKNANDCRSK